MTPWEGASRNLGFIYSPLIKESQRVEKGYFHTSDILPTLASAAGIKVPNVEGFDQWKYLSNKEGVSQRFEVVTAMDNIAGYSGLIQGKWKLVNGSLNPLYDFHLGAIEEFPISNEDYVQAVLSSPTHHVLKKQNSLDPMKVIELRKHSKISCNETDNPFTFCDPKTAPCLFNIIDDPCERKNLATLYPTTMREMRNRLLNIVYYSSPSRRITIRDRLADPSRHGGTWSPWRTEM
jgi:arylsulfatase B